jgi:hypothetical protein
MDARSRSDSAAFEGACEKAVRKVLAPCIRQQSRIRFAVTAILTNEAK